MKKIFTGLFLLINILFINKSRAIETKTNREKIASIRSRAFYKNNIAKNYLSATGNYSSDYNSTTYKINFLHSYHSWKYIHDLNFLYRHEYADMGSGKNKKFKEEKSKLYDIYFANKYRFDGYGNYILIYNRLIYDELSSYYYDRRTAIGVGRIMLDEKLEFDTSISYRQVKELDNGIDFVITSRFNNKFSEKINLVSRTYWFIDRSSLDNIIKTSLFYTLNNNLSFEIRHEFERRRYRENGQFNNQVRKDVFFGMVFFLH